MTWRRAAMILALVGAAIGLLAAWGSRTEVYSTIGPAEDVARLALSYWVLLAISIAQAVSALAVLRWPRVAGVAVLVLAAVAIPVLQHSFIDVLLAHIVATPFLLAGAGVAFFAGWRREGRPAS